MSVGVCYGRINDQGFCNGVVLSCHPFKENYLRGNLPWQLQEKVTIVSENRVSLVFVHPLETKDYVLSIVRSS